jgi:hypothetical protein
MSVPVVQSSGDVPDGVYAATLAELKAAGFDIEKTDASLEKSFEHFRAVAKRKSGASPAAAAPFDAASAPVGTVVESVGWLATNATKRDAGAWVTGEGDVLSHREVTRAVRTAPHVYAVTYPPAPEERQPCAAWELAKPQQDDDSDDSRVMYSLAPREGVRCAEVWSHGPAWTACMRSFKHVGWVPVGNVFPTLRAAQLAAEDALEADAREVLRLLGKAVP